MTDAASAPDAKAPAIARAPGKRDERPSSAKRGRFIPGTAITLAGALMAGGLGAAAFTSEMFGARLSALGYGEPTLSALPANEIAAAMPTLDPATAQAAVAEAKSCKAPLALVALVRRPGAPTSRGMAQVRSGEYLSPPFQVTDVPQWIAIPYPAPYAVGRGVLSLVGDASDLWFYLTPGRLIERLNGSFSINVVWTPGNPC
jgi:hypothetical protein